jgi:hypothetical protein
VSKQSSPLNLIHSTISDKELYERYPQIFCFLCQFKKKCKNKNLKKCAYWKMFQDKTEGETNGSGLIDKRLFNQIIRYYEDLCVGRYNDESKLVQGTDVDN